MTTPPTPGNWLEGDSENDQETPITPGKWLDLSVTPQKLSLTPPTPGKWLEPISAPSDMLNLPVISDISPSEDWDPTKPPLTPGRFLDEEFPSPPGEAESDPKLPPQVWNSLSQVVTKVFSWTPCSSTEALPESANGLLEVNSQKDPGVQTSSSKQ